MHRAALPFAVALAACSDSAEPAQPDAAVAVDAAEPAVSLTATPTTVAAGQSFTVAVDVAAFELVSPLGGATAMPGQGHFHYMLDAWADYQAGWTPSITVPVAAGTAAGPHTFTLWLVDGDHNELAPMVLATTTITVQ